MEVTNESVAQREALLGIALSAVWADGRERRSEQEALARELSALPAFEGLDAETLGAMTADAVEHYTGSGLDAFLDACVDRLDTDQQLQAYSLAVDLVLCDREVTDEEVGFLDDLRQRCGVSETDAYDIVSVLETKHGLPLAPLPPADEGEDVDPVVGPEDLVRPAITRDEAVAAFAVAAAYAEREASVPNVLGLVGLRPIRTLLAMPVSERERLLESVITGFKAWGTEEYLTASAEMLEPEERQQAFVWAADVALSDRRLTDPEHHFLTEARELLQVPPDDAARIVDVLWRKHLR